MASRARLWRAAAAVLLSLLAPEQVQAHTAIVGAGDFYAGFLHPITALEHVVPLLALGLLAGQQKGEPWTPLVCAAAVAVGAPLVALLPNLDWVRHVNAATAMLMGIFVAASWRPPTLLFLGLATVLGLGLGYLHGLELAPGMRPGLFIGGVAAATAIVLFYCAAAVRSLRPVWAQVGVRVAGSWVVAISTLVLGLAFR